jgi:hypothetical protein
VQNHIWYWSGGTLVQYNVSQLSGKEAHYLVLHPPPACHSAIAGGIEIKGVNKNAVPLRDKGHLANRKRMNMTKVEAVKMVTK